MIRKRGNKWVPAVYDPRKGKKVWLPTCDTKEEAKLAEAQAILDFSRGGIRFEATCDGFAGAWTERFPRPKESTNRHNAERVKKFSEDFKGVPLGEVTKAQARTWALENPARVAVVKAMFNDAIRDELVDRNPFAEVRTQKGRGRKDLVVPTDEQIDKLIEAARTTHGEYGRRVYANLIEFAAFSGLRAGELYGLRWEDVDMVARTVRVERQWNIKLQKVTSPKSGKARTVHLTERAKQAFERVPRDRPEVFVTPRGKRFSGGSVTYWWDPVRCAAGMPDFDFHGLRHFCGTWLARNGVPPVALMEMMGHADLQTTMVYIHLTEQDAIAQVARALGDAGPKGEVHEIRRTA